MDGSGDLTQRCMIDAGMAMPRAYPASGVKLQTVLRRAGLSAPRLTLGAPLGGFDAIEDLDLRGETWR